MTGPALGDREHRRHQGAVQTRRVDPGGAVLGLESERVDDVLTWGVAERGDAVDVRGLETRIGDRRARGVRGQLQTRDPGSPADVRDADTADDGVLLEVF